MQQESLVPRVSPIKLLLSSIFQLSRSIDAPLHRESRKHRGPGHKTRGKQKPGVRVSDNAAHRVGDLQPNGSSPGPRPISVDIHEKQTPFSSSPKPSARVSCGVVRGVGVRNNSSRGSWARHERIGPRLSYSRSESRLRMAF